MCPIASGILWSPRADPGSGPGGARTRQGTESPVHSCYSRASRTLQFPDVPDNGHRLAALIRRQTVDLDPLLPGVRRGGYSEMGADREFRVPIKMRNARSSAVPFRE